MELNGCTALVTGANRGLGRAFTDALVARGAARVYAAARDPTAVVAGDRRVVAMRLDVADPAQVAEAARACGAVDLVINNAGVMLATPMLAPGAGEAMAREFAVNVFGMQAMIAAFAPGLARRGGGAIVNVLSVASWFTGAAMATYCASKHAALVVSNAARIELRHQRTLVVGVHAGFIDTDMAAAHDGPKTAPEQVVRRALDGVEQGTTRVLADDRAEQIWALSRSDPDALLAYQQEAWDRRFAAGDEA